MNPGMWWLSGLLVLWLLMEANFAIRAWRVKRIMRQYRVEQAEQERQRQLRLNAYNAAIAEEAAKLESLLKGDAR